MKKEIDAVFCNICCVFFLIALMKSCTDQIQKQAELEFILACDAKLS